MRTPERGAPTSLEAEAHQVGCDGMSGAGKALVSA